MASDPQGKGSKPVVEGASSLDMSPKAASCEDDFTNDFQAEYLTRPIRPRFQQKQPYFLIVMVDFLNLSGWPPLASPLRDSRLEHHSMIP